MDDELELFGRAAERVHGMIAMTSQIFVKADRRRIPGALLPAADLRLNSATALRQVAELLTSNNDLPSPAAWASLVSAAIYAGISIGIVQQYEQHAGKSAHDEDPFMAEVAALAALPRASKASVIDLADRMEIDPDSLRRRIARVRRKKRP